MSSFNTHSFLVVLIFIPTELDEYNFNLFFSEKRFIVQNHILQMN
jgi:hypothetical protein